MSSSAILREAPLTAQPSIAWECRLFRVSRSFCRQVPQAPLVERAVIHAWLIAEVFRNKIVERRLHSGAAIRDQRTARRGICFCVHAPQLGFGLQERILAAYQHVHPVKAASAGNMSALLDVF